MKGTNKEMGDRDNLAEAVSAVMFTTPTVRIIPHAYEKDFVVGEMMVEHAERYLCETRPAAPGTPVPQPTDYGIYWGALFRLKFEGGGALGLLWTRENGNWRIISYEAFNQ